VLPENSTPRQLREQLQSHIASRANTPALCDWLLRLEALRYAPHSEQSTSFKQQLATLQREFQQLRWST